MSRSNRFAELPGAGRTPPILSNILLFARMLRQAGVPVSLGQSLSFAHALDWVDIGNREQVFHAARSFLVNRREDLRLFEEIFDRFWSTGGEQTASTGQKAPIAPRHDIDKDQRFHLVNYLASKARETDPEIEIGDRSLTFSNLEVLQTKEFSLMTPEELANIRRLIQEMRWRVSLRRSRRLVPDNRGDKIHLRRVLRDAAKMDGTPLRLWHRSRKIKQRPIVLIADISGSMEKYSRLILQFFYSVAQSLQQVECFVFGTRLSRITSQLRLRNIDRALDEASEEVVDWSGGTRIGDCLGAFNREWSRRVLRRGAVVLIVSDGWERGDVSQLRREMRYLQHRCHRLIWLNPHLGHSDYEPLVEGMAAALPHIDDFLPIHNMQSLQALADRLGSLSASRRTLPARRGNT
ncbi:MAG: VWA domain-containing protein [Thermoanaerobaculia bacterium]